MDFLHDGRPDGRPQGRVATRPPQSAAAAAAPHVATPPTTLLADPRRRCNVCSKEWIIRQYDHEVQGGSVIKPLVGVANDGPGDAAVVLPVLGSRRGLAIACGINPRYGDLDPYAWPRCAIDEAVRNVVAVGADPTRIAILDNFCWGNTDRPETLGSLVRAAEACHDVALAYGTPFISGKDSLNNEFTLGGPAASPSRRRCYQRHGPGPRRAPVRDDGPEGAGQRLYLVGTTKNELGGSHFHLVTGLGGGDVPRVDLQRAPKLFAAVHAAIARTGPRLPRPERRRPGRRRWPRWPSPGGVGADVTDLKSVSESLSDRCLFSESPTRFLVEVRHENAAALKAFFDSLPLRKIGTTVKESRLRIAGEDGEWLIWANLEELKEAWQKPLRW